MKHKQSEVLAGSYALNGLTAEEEAEFERLLSKSESLRAEAIELQDTAVLLGDSLPDVTPPDYLKVRIMAQIHNTPQLPAVSAEVPTAKKVSWQQRFGLAGGLTAALGAFALVGAVAIGPSIVAQPSESNPGSVVAIQQAEDYRSIRVGAADVASSVRVVWSNSEHKAAVRVHNADMPANKDLQLWIVDSKKRAVDAGVMSASTSDGWYLLNGKLEAGDSIAATIEPKGGSKHPTSDPVFVVSA